MALEVSKAKIRFALSEHGSDRFIRRNAPIKEFVFADNGRERGFELHQFVPTIVGNLIIRRIVRKVELSVNDVSHDRPIVVETGDEIVRAALIRRFSLEAQEILVKSSFARVWNRTNSQTPIGIFGVEPSKQIKEKCQKRIDEIRRIRDVVAHQALLALRMSELVDLEDFDRISFFARDMVLAVDDSVWLIVAEIRSRDEKERLLQLVASTMQQYLGRVRVAEYMSLLLVELLLILKQDVPSDADGTAQLSVIWSFSRFALSPGQRERMRIHITGRGKKTSRNRPDSRFAEATRTSKNGRQLKNFVESLQRDPKSTSLGLAYLGFMSDACRRMDVRFDAYAVTTPHGGTAINLELGL